MDSEKSKAPFQFFTEADSPTGVDDFLLLEQLRRTPEQRLEWAERMLANILELRAHAKRPALESEALIETNDPAGQPKDQLALLHLKRLQELNSHPDELQQMLEILDCEDAKTRIDPGDD